MDTAAVDVAQEIELVLPPRPEVVSVARMVVGAAVSTVPEFDEEREADLRLAVSEACTNAIQAQLSSRRNGDRHTPIVLRCTLTDRHIRLTVEDHGGGFDPERLESHPEVTDPARLDYEGGLGIPLIRLLADELAFERTPAGTTVVMTFSPRAGSERSVL